MVRDPQNAARVARFVAKIKHAQGDVSRANNRLIREVGQARANGVTWAEIGEALGMTAQGAQQRWGTRGERADVIEARETRRASKRASTDAAPSHDSKEPWPDGTVQETLD